MSESGAGGRLPEQSVRGYWATGPRADVCGKRPSASDVGVLEQVHRPDLLNYTGEQEKMSNRMIPLRQDYDEFDNYGKSRLDALAGEDEERREGDGPAQRRHQGGGT